MTHANISTAIPTCTGRTQDVYRAVFCNFEVGMALGMQVHQWLWGFQRCHGQPQSKCRSAQGVDEVGQGDCSRE